MYNIWTQFSLARMCCFGLKGFHIILSDFHNVLCIRVLFHNATNPFSRGLCVMNLKGSYDPLI